MSSPTATFRSAAQLFGGGLFGGLLAWAAKVPGQESPEEGAPRKLVANTVSRSWLEPVPPAQPLEPAQGPAQYLAPPSHPGEATPAPLWVEVSAPLSERYLAWLPESRYTVLPAPSPTAPSRGKALDAQILKTCPPLVRQAVLHYEEERPEQLLALIQAESSRNSLSKRGKVNRASLFGLSGSQRKEVVRWLKASLRQCARRQRLAEKTRASKSKERDSKLWHRLAEQWATLGEEDRLSLDPRTTLGGEMARLKPSQGRRAGRSSTPLRRGLTNPPLLWMK